MNKPSRTILIGLSAFLLAGALFLPSLALANGLVSINFEQQPLFQEANFLPGQSVTHYIEVENKSSETQPIGIEAINYSSCIGNCFSEQLGLAISRNSTVLYTGSLDDFFKAGEIKLSDLAAGTKIKYFFAVTFLPESGNQYQEKTVNFDFKIGSLGKESIGGEIPPQNGDGSSGSSSGGFFITGLEIFNEAVSNVGENEVTIVWDTNIPATSRVIYSSEHQPHILLLDSPPNYGYANSTAEDSSPKTIHSMVVSGLSPSTTYYFRCVSRGSLAISKELKFTTASVKGEETVFYPSADEFQLDSDVLGESTQENEEDILEEATGLSEEMEIGAEKELNLCWLFLLAIIILIILFLLFNKKQGGKEKFILPAVTVVAIILYYIFCCSTCWILIVAAVALFILSFVFNRKKKN